MIQNNSVVTFKYRLSDGTGKLLEEHLEPTVYLHGDFASIPRHLQDGLAGRSAGERVQVRVEPPQAFGERIDELVRHESRDKLPAGNIKVGMRIEAQREDTNEPMTFTVTEVTPQGVTLDANHPMAGTTLVFDIEILDVREASDAELDHGHVHGPGGHQH